MKSQWLLWPLLAITLLSLTPLPSWSHSEGFSKGDLDHLLGHSSLLSNNTAHTTYQSASRSDRRTPFIQGSSLSTNQFVGAVVRVLDGDTIEVLHAGRGERVRLAEIDCPEKSQAFGQRAKQFTSELVFGKEVAELGIELGSERLVMGEHERGAAGGRDHVCHRIGFAGAGHAQQRLEPLALFQTFG